MSGINYVRAGVSCLPIVGPFVALYNVSEITEEISPSSLANSVTNARISLLGTRGIMAAHTGNLERANQAIQELETLQNGLHNKYLPAAQKGRVYAICGIAGSVLSIASLVALTVLGFFSGAGLVICSAAFTLPAFFLGYNLYQHNEIIKACQSP